MQLLIAIALACQAATPGQQELSEQRIREAIELGRTGNVSIVQVGTRRSNFDVFIEGPIARIAAAAARAFQRYEPFDERNVTDAMKAPLFRVFFSRVENSRAPFVRVERIVLQPTGAKGMDGVVQPFKRPGELNLRFDFEAYFEQFPEAEFDVVLVTTGGPQKYNVTKEQRARIH